MVIFVWLMAQHPMKEELKCAETMYGVQSVIMAGAPQMPKWSADNWDLNHEVCYSSEMYTCSRRLSYNEDTLPKAIVCK